MIPVITHSKVRLSEGIQKFNATLDQKNINNIITILSSNLYSHPEQSFIRETVSNAWDSHVEAGTTDIPIIIVINKDSISIRDFGTGLSPERFREVYCSIGSSTKRESNDYIGMFGLGRFSGLSCTDNISITSYHNGIVYYYLMIKASNNISINLLNTAPTEEKNGVEVTIRNITELWKYLDALSFVSLFPNIYIDNRADSNRTYNTVKIKRQSDYYIVSEVMPLNYIAVGYILYPCHTRLSISDKFRKLKQGGIIVRLDSTEVEVTPNREQIIWSEDTIKKVKNKIEEVYTEIENKALALGKKDFNNILEYLTTKTQKYYIPLNDSFSDVIPTDAPFIYIHDSEYRKKYISYKGFYYEALLCTCLKNSIYATLKDATKRKVITTKSFFTQENIYEYLIKKKSIFIYNKYRISQTLIQFITKNTSDFIILYNDALQNLEAQIKYFMTKYGCSDRLSEELLLDVCAAIKSKVIIITGEDEDYIKYLKTIKTNNKKHTNSEKIVVKVGREYIQYNNIQALLTWCKTKQKPLYIGTNNKIKDIITDLYPAQRICNIMIGIVAKDVLKRLLSLNNPLILDINTAYKNKQIMEYYTTQSVLSTLGGEYVPSFLSHLASKLPSNYINLSSYTFYRKTCFYSSHVPKKVVVDKYLKKQLTMLVKFVEDYETIKLAYGNLPINLYLYILLKKKKYRFNWKTYDEIKNEPLIKVLCKK